MKYFTVFRAACLMHYYFVLSKRPSRSYVLSVVIASVLSTLFAFFVILLLIFKSKTTTDRFQFEVFLFHGLSYEEWRTVDVVKKKMDKVREVSMGKHQDYSEDQYLIALLLFSFLGMIEYRPESPEEKAGVVFGDLKVGDELRTHRVNTEDSNSEMEETKHRLEPSDVEMFAKSKGAYADFLKDNRYQGATLSRLVYDGVRIVFRRKKLGPKPPARTRSFMKAFGVAADL